MDLAAYADLFRQPGPWCTVYTAADAGSVDDKQTEHVRSDHVRTALLEQGADRETAEAAASAVTAAKGLGSPACRFLLARSGEVALNEEWPGWLPGPEVIRVDPVPDLSPLVHHRQDEISYLLVKLDREGGEITLGIANRPPIARTQVKGSTENISKNPRGGRSQGHYQYRTEEIWRRNAAELAHQTAKAAGTRVPVVIVAGDEHASRLFVDQLPPALRERVVTVDQETGAGEPEQMDAILAKGMADDTQALLDRLAEQPGEPNGRAVAGSGAVVSALRQSEVEVLFLNNMAERNRHLVALGDEPWIATTPDDRLAAEVIGDAPATAALIRAAVLTGAEVEVTPPGALPDGEEVAALLRWPVGPHRPGPG